MGLHSLLGSPFGLALLVFAGWLLHSLLWPYKNCSRCGGSKKLNAVGGGGYRSCPKCGGSGTATRVGRRMLGLLGSRRRYHR
ncbi:MAG: hypothetical protein QOC93_1127 [Actinomycetota bacterium]|jgi:ribosomal protein S27AE|nr:hypothetical protein [Actinomycetota bacterium]